MGSTSHSAAATVLSQEEEEVGYSPQTQVTNTTDPFAYQIPDVLPRSHCALLVNTEKMDFFFFSTVFSGAVQRPLCCGAGWPGWLEVTAQWGKGPVYALRDMGHHEQQVLTLLPRE